MDVPITTPSLRSSKMEKRPQELAAARAAQLALDTLRGLGWKVIAFSPELIAGVDPATLETASVEAYWQVLEDIGRDVEAAQKLD
jgi:hypothetical protein